MAVMDYSADSAPRIDLPHIAIDRPRHRARHDAARPRLARLITAGHSGSSAAMPA